MKQHCIVAVVFSLCWLLPIYSGMSTEEDMAWLQQTARSLPSKMAVADADSWDGAEVRRFLDGATLEQLADAIEVMPPPQMNRTQFLLIKSGVIASLRDAHVANKQMTQLYARLDAKVESWKKLGREMDDPVLLELADSLSSSITLLKSSDQVNDSLRFFATNCVAQGVYFDLDAIQLYSAPLTRELITNLATTVFPIGVTSGRGYDASSWWQPRTQSWIREREQNGPVRAFFFIRSGNRQLKFLLLDDSAGLLAPVGGTTNIYYVLGTEEANKTLDAAANFVKETVSHHKE